MVRSREAALAMPDIKFVPVDLALVGIVDELEVRPDGEFDFTPQIGLDPLHVATMIIGKVVGTVVTTISHPDYKNRRLLVVQPLTLPGDEPTEDFIALDNTQAGIGDTVLVNREGNGARQVLKNPDACVISVIVGIVNSLYISTID